MNHQSLYKRLYGKSCEEIQEMLFTECQINWNDLPATLRRGSYFQRSRLLTKFTTTELEKLPPKHVARSNPDLEIERWQVNQVELPILTKISNLMDVVFRGASPNYS